MTSSNGKIFSVTGPLCRELTGHRWIPHTMARAVELWYCFHLCLNKRLRKQSRRHRTHYDVTVMNNKTHEVLPSLRLQFIHMDTLTKWTPFYRRQFQYYVLKIFWLTFIPKGSVEMSGMFKMMAWYTPSDMTLPQHDPNQRAALSNI